MPTDTYRAAIIGLGFIGAGDQVSGDALGQRVCNLDGTHAEALARHPRVQLVAGSSRDAGRRERFGQRTGARTYADWRDMLDEEQPEIVSVAIYAQVHAEITLGCVDAGVRAVYCEKPITQTVGDAERMVSACQEAGVLLAINHNRRFKKSFRRLAALVAGGGLGELTSASLQWGSGRLGNVGTHLIDAVQMLAGREVRAVSGTLDLSGRPDCRGAQFHDPGGWGLLRLEGGLMVTVDAADYAKVPVTIVLNGTQGRAVVSRCEIAIHYWDDRTDAWPDTDADGTSMDLAVSEIVARLDGASPFPYPARAAARTLEAIVAFHASHASNTAWKELPLSGDDREIEVQSG